MPDIRKDSRLSATERQAVQGVVDRALSASHDQNRTGIAAAIVCQDWILNACNDPTLHGEMVVISAITQRLVREELSDCTLVSSLQPCEMCLSAMRFAGIKRVIFCAQQENVAAKYFVFPQLSIVDFAKAGEPFEYVGGVMEDAVIHLYETGAE
ncbi:deaminase [Loktanella sp. M215]|uniref:deaminase n=1 Tax=Loktanella sp. M215 TaxID=2675431 RepID=UPI001F2CE1DF|nr:nucleoside deaminase [Loktanella sp. M215]MCF7701747.1 hypothetical protein [Loktanella sp. M215]